MAPGDSLARLRRTLIDRAARGEATLTRLCREAGVSRSRFYEMRARYRAYGEAGLRPQAAAGRADRPAPGTAAGRRDRGLRGRAPHPRRADHRRRPCPAPLRRLTPQPLGGCTTCCRQLKAVAFWNRTTDQGVSRSDAVTEWLPLSYPGGDLDKVGRRESPPRRRC